MGVEVPVLGRDIHPARKNGTANDYSPIGGERRVWKVLADGTAKAQEYSFEDTLSYLERKAEGRVVISPESPPVYLWGTGPDAGWESRAFQGGWRAFNMVTERFADRISPYILIDDMSFRPATASRIDDQRQYGWLAASSDALRDSLLVPGRDSRTQSILILQSEVAKRVNSTECAVVDAHVNLRRITDQLCKFVSGTFIAPDNLNTTLLIPVIHPNTDYIKREQSRMLEILFRRLRADARFRGFSDLGVRDILSKTYRHVWVGQAGHVEEITLPSYDKSTHRWGNVPVGVELSL